MIARPLAAALILLATVVASPAMARGPAPAEGAYCCKVCSKGKPCGNSCISKTKQCHKPPGCACRRAIRDSMIGRFDQNQNMCENSIRLLHL